MAEIKVISKIDLKIVKDLAHKIWPIAYAEILSVVQLNYMLSRFYSIEALEKQFLNGHKFIVICKNNKPLGFASFEHKFAQSRTTKLHKLYVEFDEQGLGLGKLLINEVIHFCKEVNDNSIILNVNRFNKAIGFYTNLGFQIIKEEVIDIGNNFVMDDYVMEKILN